MFASLQVHGFTSSQVYSLAITVRRHGVSCTFRLGQDRFKKNQMELAINLTKFRPSLTALPRGQSDINVRG
jgi:hypothetical protein